MDRIHKIAPVAIITLIIVTVKDEANAIMTENMIMIVMLINGTIAVVIAILITKESLKDGISSPLEIKRADVKIINVNHNFCKDLKFYISKSECHVIICMAFFFAKFEIF